MKHGHTFEGRSAGIVVKLKSERSIGFPLTGNLYSLYGYRVDCSTRGDACDVLPPGKLPNKPVVNINDYHCSAGHSHDALLRKTAEQQGVVREGKLLECKGCSMQFLSDTRADGVPSQVVTVRSDGGGEFCGGNFGDLCRSRSIKQQLTTADSPQFNGVAERALGLIETAAMAGRIQARELFPGAQLPATGSLWAEASHWACDALNRTAASANPANKSPYEMWYGNPPPVVLLPFLKPGYCKVKREIKSQAKVQECFYLGPAPNHPRDAVRVLTKHRTLLVARHATWQRVSPSPHVPAQMHDSLSQEEEGSEADGESTSDGGGGGVMDEQDKGLARLTDLDVTRGFDLHASLRGRSKETPAAGDAGDLHAFCSGALTGGTCRRRCWRRNSRDDGLVSRGCGRRLLGPGREGRNSRDDGLVSRGRGRRLLGPRREGRNSRDDGFVSRRRGGRLLGSGREGRKRLRCISSLRHRPRERRRPPRGPVG